MHARTYVCMPLHLNVVITNTLKQTKEIYSDTQFMILLHIGGNLTYIVLAHDFYTTGDSNIIWSTFPVKTCF